MSDRMPATRSFEMIGEAVTLCRYVEKKLRGYGWHVALTGSTLYGNEPQDIDLLFYPHRDDEIHEETIDELLSFIGVSDAIPCGNNDEYGEGSAVYEFRLKSGTKVNAWIVIYQA